MKTKHILWKRFLLLQLVAGLLLGLALSGCADLSAIRKFSEISTEAENYDRITQDYANVFERKKYYISATTTESDDHTGEDLVIPPELKKSLKKQNPHAELEARRKELVENMPGFLALHKGVAEYMKALGELADDKLISYNQELKGLSDEVNKLPKVSADNKPAVEAFFALAEILSKAASDAYRRKKLQLLIGQANDPLKVIIAKQKNIIGKDYILALNDELKRMEGYYGYVIVEVIPPEKKEDWKPSIRARDYCKIITEAAIAPDQKAALMQLRDTMQQKKESIESKKKDANNYVKVLNKIQDGHQELYNNRNVITSGTVNQLISGYSTEIKKLFDTLTALK